MSIMGMREWFRKNRVLMLVIFVLLLVGLLISYGRFGSSAGYSAADFEAMLTQAREAYNEDPTNPENVYYLAQVLSQYAEFMNTGEENREKVQELDDEALVHYDEYYGILAEQSKTAYQENKNYGNAAMVANYLGQRAQVQSMINGLDGAALSSEANNWMIIALGHRQDEINQELAEKPNDPALLADLADSKSALGYYNKLQNGDYDTAPLYRESLALYLQAVENSGADVAAETKAGYYTNAGFCANSLGDKASAEQYLKTAVELAPASYDMNLNYLSFLLNDQRYEEGKALMEACRDAMSKEDPNYQNTLDSIESVQALMDAMNNGGETGDNADNADNADNGDNGENGGNQNQ